MSAASRIVVGAMIILAGAAGGDLAAQSSPAPVSVGGAWFRAPAPGATAFIEPRMGWSSERLSVDLRGRVIPLGSSPWSLLGSARARVDPLPGTGFSVVVDGGLFEYRSPTGDESRGIAGGAELHWRGSRAGAWLKASRSDLIGVAGRSAERLGLGVWTRIAGGEAELSLRRTSFADTTVRVEVIDHVFLGEFHFEDRTTRLEPRGRSYLEAEARLTRALGSVEVGMEGGVRLRSRYTEPDRWGRATFAAPLGDDLTIRAGAGWRGSRPEVGLPGGATVSLGLTVDVASRSPEPDAPDPPPAASPPPPVDALYDLAPAEDLCRGCRTLVLRGMRARRVELRADFTGWEPVSLEPAQESTPDGRAWALTTVLPPGVHRMAVRMDGGPWAAPPGWTSVPTEFGTEVAILVVP